MSEPARSEVELLFSLVRDRHGSRLAPEELEAVRTAVEAIVEAVRALRAVRLDNTDGPLLPSRPDLPRQP